MSESIVVNCDCMKYMRRVPDKAFDLAVVDPPYFSGPERRGYYGSRVSKIGVHRDYPISPQWDIPGAEYFEELQRVSKHYIVWGCNYFDYHFAPGRIVWDKCNSSSSFSDCELAATDSLPASGYSALCGTGCYKGRALKRARFSRGTKN